MSDFRELAHLHEQVGEEGFAALIDSGNTGKVKAFCEQLIKDALPTEITVGGRTYDILGFHQEEDKGFVSGKVMVTRAKEMDAYPGKDDGEHFLKHQEEIPAVLRGKVVFVFTDWRSPGGSEGVACVGWGGERWVQGWSWLVSGFYDGCRVLRRKKVNIR